MELHWDILDTKRRDLLPTFGSLKPEGFYLAGGTALALLIGHRDSIDFDFFKHDRFDTGSLWNTVANAFSGHHVVKTQEEAGTLSVLIDDDVRASFIHFPYPLVAPAIETPHFPIASMEDIACMKLNAMTGRTAFKDYIDMYFILQTLPLTDIMRALQTKMPSLEPLLALKSLAYFEDVREEHIIFKTAPVTLAEVRQGIQAAVTRYGRSLEK